MVLPVSGTLKGALTLTHKKTISSALSEGIESGNMYLRTTIVTFTSTSFFNGVVAATTSRK